MDDPQSIADQVRMLAFEKRLDSQSSRIDLLRKTLTDLETNHAALRAELHGLGTGEPGLWRRFCEWMKRPAW